MKPLFILLTVLSSFMAQAKNNPGGEVTPAALKSFSTTFAQASDVTWTAIDDMYKVSFQVAGQYAAAYYSNNGNLMVVTRNISSLQLPVVLLASIKKDYNQRWISDLVEVSDENGTYYYVTLEDADQKLILKSDGATRWNKYQKYEK
ncbi:hypothetical protein [Paracnuella aquatica]|uniref:hypothetical protein n=1 Tax=Paracnuella aquatica TaxID=2268757 RepID=UPI000F4E26EC|nr:hypothetical protein [Paracnuella aquatica]RPD51870.1 hypothetical protein DRJ53_04120 [Paracnuella aquatica]